MYSIYHIILSLDMMISDFISSLLQHPPVMSCILVMYDKRWYLRDSFKDIVHILFCAEGPLPYLKYYLLTHWGRVTHICVGKLIIIGSDNGLSPGRRQAIIWTNAGILLIGPSETNFSEVLIRIQTFPLKKIPLKMSSPKWRPFCLGLNVLRPFICFIPSREEELRQSTMRTTLGWQQPSRPAVWQVRFNRSLNR